MKKSVLFLAVVLVIISISMTSFSKSKLHDESCEGNFTLERELVERMKQKYKDTQLKLINRKLKFRHHDKMGDAKEIWFSLDTLKAFICQIENEIDAKSENLGIRIYYVAYPKKREWKKYPDLQIPGKKPSVPKSYAERHTLVLIPTVKKSSTSGHQDYIPPQNPQSGTAHYMAMGLTDTSDYTESDSEETESPTKNHGNLFPPG